MADPLSSNTAFVELQQSYANWLKLRGVSIPLFQDLVNLRNKATHLQQSKLNQAVGVPSSSTRISVQVYDEISDVVNALEEIHRGMERELEKISAIQKVGTGSAQTFPASANSKDRDVEGGYRENVHFPVKFTVLDEMLAQLRDQTSLEDTLLARLRDHTHGGEKDQDLSVTIMACLTYPSYLRKDSLKLLLDFKS